MQKEFLIGLANKSLESDIKIGEIGEKEQASSDHFLGLRHLYKGFKVLLNRLFFLPVDLSVYINMDMWMFLLYFGHV